MERSIGIKTVVYCVTYGCLALGFGLLVSACVGYYGFGMIEGPVYEAGVVGSYIVAFTTIFLSGMTMQEKLAERL